MSPFHVVRRRAVSTRTGTVYFDGTFQISDWSRYDRVYCGGNMSPGPVNDWDLRTQVASNTFLTLQNSITRSGVPFAAKLETRTPTDIQYLVAPGVNGGSFSLTWNGSTATAIPYNVTRASLESRLNALSSIVTAGGVTVHGMDYDNGGAEYLLGSTINGPNGTLQSKFFIVFNVAGPRVAFSANSGGLSGGSITVAAGDGTTEWAYTHQAVAVQSYSWNTVLHSGPGNDTYYGMSFYFPGSDAGIWNGLFFQIWELIMGGFGPPPGQPDTGGGILTAFEVLTNGAGGSSPSDPRLMWQMNVDSNGYNVGNYRTHIDSTTLQYNVWYDLVLRIKWATDATGICELWQNGTKVYSTVDGTGGAPIGGLRTYPNSGGQVDGMFAEIYTSGTYPITIYETGIRIGDSYGAVRP